MVRNNKSENLSQRSNFTKRGKNTEYQKISLTSVSPKIEYNSQKNFHAKT